MRPEQSETESSADPLHISTLNDDVERRDDVPVLACENGLWNGVHPKPKKQHYVIKKRFWNMRRPEKCREATILTTGIVLTCIALGLIVAGSARLRECQTFTMVRLKHPVGEATMEHIGDEFFAYNQLTALNNYAFHKSGTQSSTDLTADFKPEEDGDAVLAVDGSISTCSRTDAETDPKWQVDLSRLIAVRSIRIFSSNTSVLHDFDVYLGVAPHASHKKLCFHHQGNVHSRDTRIVCDEAMSGRFLTIVLRTSGYKLEHLVLCEVMVFGR
ncbi:uncharacterized protein LOC124114346 isoform X1 [Haliotis rufescens]|uniref:uncharacterized protein LOC124114346 isoform X1 n=1 Tax=Haliotis rufescens TaxID=6454 RepID=UPI001EAF8EC5|nr:uncharacterized protein LOC124114346 isoform X1 [Haliotis rufescens]XP_046330815.1 uncharacterized protein LOC124114346 isoform X1 [Haliotis rufescens]XP_046330816.1 uncharacterized protein LOC124114346 isoform X1 [Haliotis rufescens]XP_046330817.1 uncharacterized protein LOC124114346 isoform X1 [Haliotis rufescens]